jgi:hypothetical protein
MSAIALTLTAAPAVAGKKEQMTPLAIQAMQSKEFEAAPRVMFRSVVSVFQDLGYTIDSADFDSGLITATSATKNKTNFWGALAGVAASGNTRATATVEELANGRTLVRLNFVSSKNTSSKWGQTHKNDKPILEAEVYQVAFEKIDEALFVRQATNSPSATPVSSPAVPPANTVDKGITTAVDDPTPTSQSPQ